MQIHFIRHTTPKVESGVCYGQADIAVTENFDHESTQILKTLELEQNAAQYDFIFSSPAKRCHVLAEKINQFQNKPKGVSIRSDLQEFNFGDWELQAWNDIPNSETQPWMDDWIYSRPPNGESLIEMQDRVQNFLNEIITLKCQYACVCTHAGVMRLIAAQYLNIPLSEIFNIHVQYGQIMTLSKDSNHYSIHL